MNNRGLQPTSFAEPSPRTARTGMVLIIPAGAYKEIRWLYADGKTSGWRDAPGRADLEWPPAATGIEVRDAMIRRPADDAKTR